MRLSDYRENIELQKNGAPIPVGEADFFVRRHGTPEYKKFEKKLSQELFGPFHRHTETDDDLLRAHMLVEYLVTGWRNVKNIDGTELPYSIENARKIFLNPEYFLNINIILDNASRIFSNYLYEQADEDIEALKKP